MPVPPSALLRINGAALCLIATALSLEFSARCTEKDRDAGRFSMPARNPPGGPADSPARSNRFRTQAIELGPCEAIEEWSKVQDSTPRFSFSHNLSRILPLALQTKNSEFFPLVNGKRHKPPKGSESWNPDLGREDVAAYAADAAKRYFATQPERDSFSVGINDGLVFGESAETLAAIGSRRWFRERPDYSNLVFQFTNRVAEDVARTHPNKYIGALAYYWAENAPDFPLHPNVVPFLTADRSQGYNRSFREEELLLQRRWVERAKPGNAAALSSRLSTLNSAAPVRRLGLYDYLYGNGFLIPRLHSRLIAEYLRHARQVGFTDYYAEMYPNWGLDGPQPWLVAQLLQNPNQSSEVLIDRYYHAEYGTAASLMRRFFERCEWLWMTQSGPSYWLKHYRNESQAHLFPADECRRLRGWLDAALAFPTASEVQERVQLVSRAFGVTERLGELQRAREVLNTMLFSSEPQWRLLTSGLERFVLARREFVRYATGVLNSGRSAISPFRWEDYLRHDPGSAALLQIDRAARSANERSMADAEVRRIFAGPADQEGTGAVYPSTSGESPVWGEDLGEHDIEVWQSLGDSPSSGKREAANLLTDGMLEGELQSPRRIAGLDYGVALPAGWHSYVEPAQYQRAVWKDRYGQSGRGAAGNAPALRLSGNKETSVFKWVQVGRHGVHHAGVWLRGSLRAGTNVSLTFGWMDGRLRRVGLKTLRLPEGEWPEWVYLNLAALPPRESVWVGVGVRIQNQVENDWVELKGFELKCTALP